jgi:hypothetical protein
MDAVGNKYRRNEKWKQNFSLMKFSRAISRVKWLSGEQTNVSKTISVLNLRVLVWQRLGKTFSPNIYIYIYIPGPDCLRDRSMGGFDSRFAWIKDQTSTLRTRSEMVFETLVCTPLNHLTRLIASRRKSNKSHKILVAKLGRKRPVWITTHSWKDNINMDLKHILYEGVE